MQTFGAQYVVYENSGFLDESVHRIYPFLEKIVFLVGFEPWNGKGNREYPAQSIRDIFAMPDPDKKFVVIQKYWATEEDQRNDGLKVLRELGCDWCVVVDDDEMFNRQQFYNAIQMISNLDPKEKQHSAYVSPHLIYWKNRDTVIDKLAGALPTFVHTTDVHFSKNRACTVYNDGTWGGFDASDLVTHHLSYVRSDEQMLRKISTFSHADEIRNDWYENKWLEWDPGITNLHPVNPESFYRAIPAHSQAHILEPIPQDAFTPETSLYTSYVDYRRSQLVEFKSHESENYRWTEGQKRFIERFMNYPLDAQILDISCGDGIGLRDFRARGYTHVEGFEWDNDKVAKARESGCRVHQGDMHNLQGFPKRSFDVVYSSHTLEHAFNPRKVLQQFRHVIRPTGELVLVVPFPDTGPDRAHCGKYELGTGADDRGARLMTVLKEEGFVVVEHRFDSFREPEIWLRCKPVEGKYGLQAQV